MKTCLIVDDSKIVRNVMQRIVSNLGFSILEAENGREGLAMVRMHPVDVMLLDWHMPLMDGLECMNHIRADPSITQPKIIFCTTENESHKIAEAMSGGADEYIVKPFDEVIIGEKLLGLGLITAIAS